MLLKTVECGVCKTRYTEKSPNDGFPNWGQLSGAALNGDANPYLCPEHFGNVKAFVQRMLREMTRGDE